MHAASACRYFYNTSREIWILYSIPLRSSRLTTPVKAYYVRQSLLRLSTPITLVNAPITTRPEMAGKTTHSRTRNKRSPINYPPQTSMTFHGQIQTFVHQMTGEVVIAQSHITHIGNPLGAEAITSSEVHEQSQSE